LYITAILEKINPQLTTEGFFCLAKWHICKLEGCYGIGVGYIHAKSTDLHYPW
jgi:hypothetical protein